MKKTTESYNWESKTKFRTELNGNLALKSFVQVRQIFYIEQC